MATLPRFPPHRLNLNKSRLLTRAAKGFLGKPLTKAPDPTPGSQSFDYIPLVSGPRPQPPTCYLRGLPVSLLPIPPPSQREGDLDLPAPVGSRARSWGLRVSLKASTGITNILCGPLSLL